MQADEIDEQPSPANNAADQKSGVKHHATTKDLCFKAGNIAGAIDLQHFASPLLKAFDAT